MSFPYPGYEGCVRTYNIIHLSPDLQRQMYRHKVPHREPTHFPQNTVNAMKLLAGIQNEQKRIAATHALYQVSRNVAPPPTYKPDSANPAFCQQMLSMCIHMLLVCNVGMPQSLQVSYANTLCTVTTVPLSSCLQYIPREGQCMFLRHSGTKAGTWRRYQCWMTWWLSLDSTAERS